MKLENKEPINSFSIPKLAKTNENDGRTQRFNADDCFFSINMGQVALENRGTVIVD